MKTFKDHLLNDMLRFYDFYDMFQDGLALEMHFFEENKRNASRTLRDITLHALHEINFDNLLEEFKRSK